MKNPVKTFEPNTQGHDFVVGDLHGSLDRLEAIMKHVNFDKTKDRMFSVGDLVDRGPRSIECLRLLREDWFHAVLSNHEQMMLEAFQGGYMGQFWLQNGGGWGADAFMLSHELKKQETDPEYQLKYLSDEAVEIIDLQALVEELPYLITVNMPDGKKFHVIHAELPPGHNGLTDSDLSSPDKVYRTAQVQSRDGDCFLWSRFLFAGFYRSALNDEQKVVRTVAYKYRNTYGPFNDKLSHIISGHTIMQRPVTLLGQTNIDTGAYGSYDRDARDWEALTVVDLHTWTFYQANANGVRVVEPLTISKDRIDALKPEFAAIDKANNMG